MTYRTNLPSGQVAYAKRRAAAKQLQRDLRQLRRELKDPRVMGAERARAEQVATEMQAQVDKLIEAGIIS